MELTDVLKDILIAGLPVKKDEGMWTFQDHKMHDLEFNTKKELTDHIDTEYMEQCQDDKPVNGDYFTDHVFLLNFVYNDIGEIKLISKERYDMEYTHILDDYAEHFSQGDYL